MRVRITLEIPIRGLVFFFEAVLGEEVERWAFVARGKNTEISLDGFFASRAILGNALAAVIHAYSIFGEIEDVTA